MTPTGAGSCALSATAAPKFDPEAVELYFESEAGRILIYKDGQAADYSEEEATKILSCPAVTVVADMKMGEAQATAWGCDLTYDYVKINAGLPLIEKNAQGGRKMEQKEMDQVMQKASVLIEALPYIQKFNRKIIVVKYGGKRHEQRGTAEKRHSGCHPA